MVTCVNCAPSGTPVVVQGASPVKVTGSGTPTDPLIVGLVTDSSNFALQVRDSDTINFTIYGTGSDEDPYVLTGDTSAAAKLSALSDVQSDPPVAGQVPTWVGPTSTGHWEFQSPAAVDLGSIDAGAIKTGTLAAARLPNTVLNAPVEAYVNADWNSLITAGMHRVWATASNNQNAPAGAYLFGTLVVLTNGQSVTQMYAEHGRGNLYWRTKWNASDWTPWGCSARIDNDIELDGTAAFSALSGYPLQSATLIRSGNNVTFQVQLVSTAALSNAGHLDGNVLNYQIGTVPVAHAPKAGVAPITTTVQGVALTGYVDPTGAVWISSMPSGISSTSGAAIVTSTNYPVCVGGSWIAKKLVA